MASLPHRAAFPTGPLLDPETGVLSTAWHGFFMSLYNRLAANEVLQATKVGKGGDTMTGGLVTPLLVATTVTTGGAGGPTWTTGTGPPGAAVAPVGSLYSNIAGAVGARLYVSSGPGTWTALPGVS